MIPDTLLHYRILQSLGSGGMGEVFLAEDTKLGRRVALKVLRGARAGDPEGRQRFEREAKAVAALNHPNIVTIYSVGQASDITFLTMELVEGQALSDVIPKGGLPVDRLLQLAIPLADAVAAAHERGITHRDLKPANVMVTVDGRVKVLDFGLAKLREVAGRDGATMTALSPEPLTGEGRIVGTVAYMSPEQAEGKALDSRSDLFSLGILLYELATGERPFKGDTSVSVISSIIKDTPPSVTDVNRSLPRDVARIVKRALVKDPDHRYQTAKDLRNDLETLKEELDSGVADVPAAGLAPTTRGTSPRWILPATGLVALIIIIVGAAWYLRSGREPQAPLTRPFDNIKLTRLTSTGKVSWAVLSPDARYVAHVVSDAGKRSLWLRQVATTSNLQIVAPDDVRYDGVTFSPDGNYVYYVIYPRNVNFSIAYQVPVLGGVPRKIIEDVDTPLAFSPDGRQFAFLRGDSARGETALIVAAADGSGERRLVAHKNPLSFPLNNVAWSPDGSRVAALLRTDAQGRMQVVTVDVASGAETSVGQKAWDVIDSVTWMPDGRELVIAAADTVAGSSLQVWLLSYPLGDARRVTNDLNNYGQVSVSADAKILTAVQGEGLAHVWVAPFADPALATQITTGTGRVDGTAGLSWTPDGRIVYASHASEHSDIWIADASGANARQLTVDPDIDSDPVVTPDGRSIIFFSSRSGGALWQMDLDGSNQRVFLKDPSVGRVVVSPDSKWVYYTSFAGTPRLVWRMPLGGGAPERLTAHWDELGITGDGVFYHPTLAMTAISPDGTMAAGYYADVERRGWRVGVFPIAGGKPKRFEIVNARVSWTPDGRSLLYLESLGGISNLFAQPLDGGPPTPLTHFTTDGIFDFALSRDGKQLALSRGTETSDVVLITNVAK